MGQTNLLDAVSQQLMPSQMTTSTVKLATDTTSKVALVVVRHADMCLQQTFFWKAFVTLITNKRLTCNKDSLTQSEGRAVRMQCSVQGMGVGSSGAGSAGRQCRRSRPRRAVQKVGGIPT